MGVNKKKTSVKQQPLVIEHELYQYFPQHPTSAMMADEAKRRRQQELDYFHEKSYNVLFSHTTGNTAPQLNLRFHGASNVVSLNLKLDFKAGQWTPATITAQLHQRMTEFMCAHQPLKRIHDRNIREESDIVRRLFYSGVVKDVYYRNSCPFFPHPALMKYLAQWDREQARICNVIDNVDEAFLDPECAEISADKQAQMQHECDVQARTFNAESPPDTHPADREYSNSRVPPLPQMPSHRLAHSHPEKVAKSRRRPESEKGQHDVNEDETIGLAAAANLITDAPPQPPPQTQTYAEKLQTRTQEQPQPQQQQQTTQPSSNNEAATSMPPENTPQSDGLVPEQQQQHHVQYQPSPPMQQQQQQQRHPQEQQRQPPLLDAMFAAQLESQRPRPVQQQQQHQQPQPLQTHQPQQQPQQQQQPFGFSVSTPYRPQLSPVEVPIVQQQNAFRQQPYVAVVPQPQHQHQQPMFTPPTPDAAPFQPPGFPTPQRHYTPMPDQSIHQVQAEAALIANIRHHLATQHGEVSSEHISSLFQKATQM